jgi:hypothetical protein
MRHVRWLGLGLGVLACSSSKLGGNDGGIDAPSVTDTGAVDRPVGEGGVGSCSDPGYTQEGSYRPTMAWTFSAAALDAGAAVRDAGTTDDAASVSRCVASGSPATTGLSDYTCRGGAWLRAGTAGPVLAFDDGATLTWNPSSAPVPAPYVTASGGDRVWVSYQSKATVICPFCGAYTNRWLEIRNDGSSGTIRHYAQQGNHLTSPAAIAMAMFGVTVTDLAQCQLHVGSCPSFDRTELGHQVATTPAQTVPFATLTEVASPGGTYDVLWASTSDSNVQYATSCGSDLKGASNDDGFAATRQPP